MLKKGNDLSIIPRVSHVSNNVTEMMLVNRFLKQTSRYMISTTMPMRCRIMLKVDYVLSCITTIKLLLRRTLVRSVI